MLHAVTMSYSWMPASASAKEAVQMATARSDPPDSRMRQHTSTVDFGKVCSCTAGMSAELSCVASSSSSGVAGSTCKQVLHQELCRKNPAF